MTRNFNKSIDIVTAILDLKKNPEKRHADFNAEETP